jgi:hypothetical protein
LFQNFGFWNKLPEFGEKTGLWQVFPGVWHKTGPGFMPNSLDFFRSMSMVTVRA